MQSTITIRNARLHNLKNVSLAIPKNQLVVLTGISGSGKSTLAFDILHKEALRQSILKKAFEGKLVPQEPNDEPASVLLERIAAARQNAGPVKRTKKETFVRRKRRV